MNNPTKKDPAPIKWNIPVMDEFSIKKFQGLVIIALTGSHGKKQVIIAPIPAIVVTILSFISYPLYKRRNIPTANNIPSKNK